jgi:hypothetical protein
MMCGIHGPNEIGPDRTRGPEFFGAFTLIKAGSPRMIAPESSGRVRAPGSRDLPPTGDDPRDSSTGRANTRTFREG